MRPGVVQTSGWMTGFPVRTSFGRGFPEHDTWRFDATRLIESGEADAALWISAYEPARRRLGRKIFRSSRSSPPQTRLRARPRCASISAVPA